RPGVVLLALRDADQELVKFRIFGIKIIWIKSPNIPIARVMKEQLRKIVPATVKYHLAGRNIVVAVLILSGRPFHHPPVPVARIVGFDRIYQPSIFDAEPLEPDQVYKECYHQNDTESPNQAELNVVPKRLFFRLFRRIQIWFDVAAEIFGQFGFLAGDKGVPRECSEQDRERREIFREPFRTELRRQQYAREHEEERRLFGKLFPARHK